MTIETIAIITGMAINFGAIGLMIRKTGEWMGSVGAELRAIHGVLEEIKVEAIASRGRLDDALQRLSRLEGKSAA